MVISTYVFIIEQHRLRPTVVSYLWGMVYYQAWFNVIDGHAMLSLDFRTIFFEVGIYRMMLVVHSEIGPIDQMLLLALTDSIHFPGENSPPDLLSVSICLDSNPPHLHPQASFTILIVLRFFFFFF